MLATSLALDAAARPRVARPRRLQGIALHLLVMTAVFGLCLAGSGNPPVAGILASGLMALFTVASNAKYKMLGEPLVFSDLALIVSIVRHPGFYFTAVSKRQRWMMGAGASTSFAILVLLFSTRLEPHLLGCAMSLAAGAALSLLLRSRWLDSIAQNPNLASDLAQYGMIATLLLYWWRWQHTADPAPCPKLAVHSDATAAAAPELIVIVQCESFADPVEIIGDPRLALQGLTRARAAAWQHGELAVSGFGAYTMRTEFGVLFGRSEAALGFRRYDPFLSAHGETSYALSARLAAVGYGSTFVHPHDLRFYARDRLMPAIGFDRVIGKEAFAPVPPGSGRYVDDRTLGATLADLAAATTGPTLLYAVTMENHGPWDADRIPGFGGGFDAYLQHLRNSDTMLTELIARIASDGRPALLVFFGDHRPAIPGVSMPETTRHTPYVMMRFAAGGRPIDGPGQVNLTPAGLHHAVLRCVA